MSDLLDALPRAAACEAIAPGAWLLRGFCAQDERPLVSAVEAVEAQAPSRRMRTRRGSLSVAMTNCGALGWVSDTGGYRYDPVDPLTGRRWPRMPALFADVAARAALACGFGALAPDACLINRYAPGTRLSLHQDRDELDHAAPIVSVSLGLAAVFMFGGPHRSDPVCRFRLQSGDVAVWGGVSRLALHGIASVPEGDHPLCGRWRINLTFRTTGSRHCLPLQ